MSQERTESDCVFCHQPQAEDDRESLIVYRGSSWYVILNLYPYTSGHIMIVPYRHVRQLANLNSEERESLLPLLVEAEQIVGRVYNPHGVNIGLNLGEAAGAGILGHLHFHLVPRWRGDSNFMTSVGEVRVVPEDLGESFQKLKPHFDEVAK